MSQRTLSWMACIGIAGAVGATSCRPAAPGPPLPLGQEQVPPGEAEAIPKIVQLVEEQLAKEYPPGDRPMRRDAHAKAHGCVKARFTVADSLPPEMRYGVFVPGRSYDAWVRYSNGSGLPQADKEGDGRGMAVKLMGVPGRKLLEGEQDAQTQDFLMINRPVFFVRDAVDYVSFQRDQLLGHSLDYFINLQHPDSSHILGLINAQAILRQQVGNPFAVQYWTMTPYRLGPTAAVKMSAAPCTPLDNAVPANPGPDYLQQAMVRTLSTGGGACFRFMVQLQTDAEKMPVEDPQIEWPTSLSPFRTVATITIPPQEFTSPEQMTFCDNLSYTPWHALPDHRPLGGINRVRLSVYQAISQMRHTANGAPRREPTSFSIAPSN